MRLNNLGQKQTKKQSENQRVNSSNIVGMLIQRKDALEQNEEETQLVYTGKKDKETQVQTIMKAGNLIA